MCSKLQPWIFSRHLNDDMLKLQQQRVTNCKSCLKMDGQVICTSCDSTFLIKMPEMTSCIPKTNCLNNQYVNLEETQCLSCPDPLCKCCNPSNPDFCLICDGSNSLNLFTSKCSQACPIGFFKLKKNYPAISTVCSGAAERDECVRCSTQFCSDCSLDIGNCTKCISGKILHENTCLDNCPIGYYVGFAQDLVSMQCNKCLDTNNCQYCDPDTQGSRCQICFPPLVPDNSGICGQSCPEGQYQDRNLWCQLCPIGCKFCSSITCLSCLNSDYKVQGPISTVCAPGCPRGFQIYQNSSTNICSECRIADCAKCSENRSKCERCHDTDLTGKIQNFKVSSDDFSCVAKCGSDEYELIENNIRKCVKCPDWETQGPSKCVRCSQTGMCQECAPTHSLYIDKLLGKAYCKIACPNQTFTEILKSSLNSAYKICRDCGSSTCKVCNDEQTCQICLDSNKLVDFSNPSLCINCPGISTLTSVNSGGFCKACHASCGTCFGEQETSCLECKPQSGRTLSVFSSCTIINDPIDVIVSEFRSLNQTILIKFNQNYQVSDFRQAFELN